MKRFIITSLLIVSAFAVCANNPLILAKVENDAQLHSMFENPHLNIHYYNDSFIIASLEEGNTIAQESVVLDETAFSDTEGYFIVYCPMSLRQPYLTDVQHDGKVLYSNNDILIMKPLGENPLLPAKNDGIVFISQKKASLPQEIASYPVITEPDDDVVDLISQVSTTSVMGYIQSLEDFVSRRYDHANGVLAQNWIKAQYEEMGLEVELQTLPYPSNSSKNVIAIQRGTVYPDEYIVLGGHYDTYTYESPNNAPGADDDASGSAGVMETARILSQYEFERTIIYCAFSAEEIGLFGSDAYATRCQQQGMNILGYFNLDMTGYLTPGDPIHFCLIYPNVALTLADYFVNISDIYFPTVPVTRHANLPWGDSDHTSFNNKGYKGIWWFEDINCDSPFIHHTAGSGGCGNNCTGSISCLGDIIGPSVNNSEQVTVFTQAMVACIATLAVLHETPFPIAAFMATPTEVVEGNPVQFTDLSKNDPIEWHWTFEGGMPETSEEQNPEVVYNTPGEYDVTLEIANGYGSNELTKQKYITVTMLPPVADFTADVFTIEEGETISFTNMSSENSQSFSWVFEGGTPMQSTQETPPAILYKNAGTYSVRLKATNAGGTHTEQKDDYITVTPKTAIGEQTLASKIEIYPNPTDGQLIIEMCDMRYETCDITIYDIYGKKYQVSNLKSQVSNHQIDISDLPEGIYFIQIQTEEGMITKKIIKK